MAAGLDTHNLFHSGPSAADLVVVVLEEAGAARTRGERRSVTGSMALHEDCRTCCRAVKFVGQSLFGLAGVTLGPA